MRMDSLNLEGELLKENGSDYLSFSFTCEGKRHEFDFYTPLRVPNKPDDALEICFPVQKVGTLENDIYQIKYNKKTVGWVIPGAALHSSQHDYFDNPYFLKAARKAIEESVVQYFKSKKESSGTITDINSDLVNYSGFKRLGETGVADYAVSFVVLYPYLIDSFACLKEIEYSSVISLLKHGFYSAHTKLLANLNFLKDKPRSHVKLSRVMELDSGFSELIDILNSDNLFCTNDLLRFFILYQGVEYLIEIIHEKELEGLITEYTSSESSLHTKKEIASKLSNIRSEKTRLDKLEFEYTDAALDLNPLKAKCNDLLEDMGEKVGQSLSKTVYSVRNKVFHSYRAHQSVIDERLSEINLELISVLADYLSTFGKEEEYIE